jgi:hypothetical protein
MLVRLVGCWSNKSMLVGCWSMLAGC